MFTFTHSNRSLHHASSSSSLAHATTPSSSSDEHNSKVHLTKMRRSERQIRKDFYHKLGLLGNKKRLDAGTTESKIIPATELRVAITRETRSNIVTSTTSSHHARPVRKTSSKKQEDKSVLHIKPRRSVSFCEYVKVDLIPSHREYDELTKDAIWNGSRIIRSEMKRNLYEMWAEGGDWRSAFEEDDMIRAPDGSLVHPATWTILMHTYYYASSSPAEQDAYYECSDSESESGDEEGDGYYQHYHQGPTLTWRHHYSYTGTRNNSYSQRSSSANPLPPYRSTLQATRQKSCWGALDMTQDCYLPSSCYPAYKYYESTCQLPQERGN